MFYDRLKKVCDENNTNMTALSKRLKFSSGNISKWKNGGIPKSETLVLIAKELSISTDYLLGLDDVANRKEKKPIPDLTDIEYRALKAFGNLTPDDKIEFAARMEQRYEDYSPEQKENVS